MRQQVKIVIDHSLFRVWAGWLTLHCCISVWLLSLAARVVMVEKVSSGMGGCSSRWAVRVRAAAPTCSGEASPSPLTRPTTFMAARAHSYACKENNNNHQSNTQ